MEQQITHTTPTQPLVTRQTSVRERVSFRVARSASEREAIYKLRYRVYVEEMGRNQKWADHPSRRIEEPLDAKGILIGAFLGNELIGTCRLNFTHDPAIEYRELYDFERFERLFPRKVMFTSKLMILPQYRGSALFLDFMRACFRLSLEAGAEANVIDCNDHLVGVFTRLGFRQYQEKVEHPLYGWVTPMVMFHFDLDHYRRVRSPLGPIVESFLREGSLGEESIRQQDQFAS